MKILDLILVQDISVIIVTMYIIFYGVLLGFSLTLEKLRTGLNYTSGTALLQSSWYFCIVYVFLMWEV